MIDKICTLYSTDTQDLVPLQPGKFVVGCQWVYMVKVGLDDKVDWLRVRLIAKGYTQIFGLDYGIPFLWIPKLLLCNYSYHCYHLSLVYLLVEHKECFSTWLSTLGSLHEATSLICSLVGVFQFCMLLTKFLYSLKKSPIAWFNRFSTLIQQLGMTQSEVDHSLLSLLTQWLNIFGCCHHGGETTCFKAFSNGGSWQTKIFLGIELT